MILPTVTLEDVLPWLTSCTEEKLYKHNPGRDWTAENILSLKSVSAETRLRIVLREDFIPSNLLRLFAADCAVRALVRRRKNGSDPDLRSLEAVRVARDYALGKATCEDLSNAWNTAKAARDSAEDFDSLTIRAALAAALAAVKASPQISAWDSAANAAWSAWAAWENLTDRNAACKAERNKQVERLFSLFEWARTDG